MWFYLVWHKHLASTFEHQANNTLVHGDNAVVRRGMKLAALLSISLPIDSLPWVTLEVRFNSDGNLSLINLHHLVNRAESLEERFEVLVGGLHIVSPTHFPHTEPQATTAASLSGRSKSMVGSAFCLRSTEESRHEQLRTAKLGVAAAHVDVSISARCRL